MALTWAAGILEILTQLLCLTMVAAEARACLGERRRRKRSGAATAVVIAPPTPAGCACHAPMTFADTTHWHRRGGLQ